MNVGEAHVRRKRGRFLNIKNELKDINAAVVQW